jgi:bifunctional non-homologous end joining protein LigD
VFNLLRHGDWIKPAAVLIAFDLVELNGEDFRLRPIELRKALLTQLVRRAPAAIRLSEHIHGDGAEIFAHACKLGCEGIVSKRLGSRYISGRTDVWVKVKNPHAPAVRREAEEDWAR